MVEIVRLMDFLLYIIIVEMYWKEYGFNKFGVIIYFLVVCLGIFGMMFFVDYIDGCFIKVRMYNFVEVECVGDGFVKL